jgi:hypothetical protein
MAMLDFSVKAEYSSRLQNRTSQRNRRMYVHQRLSPLADTLICTGKRLRQNNRENTSTHQVTCTDTTFKEAGCETNPPVIESLISRTNCVDLHTLSPSCPESPSTVSQVSSMQQELFTADDLLSQHDLAWISTSVGNGSSISQPGPMPHVCFCNNVTGPCAGHLERLRSQSVAEPSATSSLYQQHLPYRQYQNWHTPSSDMPLLPHTPPSWFSRRDSRCVFDLLSVSD